MKTPQEWVQLLDPSNDNAHAWATVGAEAKAYLLANVDHGDMISTATLVDALFPVIYAKQSEAGMAARLRIVDALTNRYADKYELRGCFTLGPPEAGRKRFVGKTIRRRLWHPPVPAA